MKLALNALILGAALTCFAGPSLADSHKKSSKKPAATKEVAPTSAEDLDISHATAVDMECAMGDKVTLYQNADDNKHIGVRWKKMLVKLDQVQTTTGAQRYESPRHGLVWIGIPAKGMLLDSKKGQQLANECRTREQLAVKTAPATESQLLQEARK
jgi:hypothetical protein